MIKKMLLNGLVMAACLAAGLWLGPLARVAYERAFPLPLYITGDYSDVYSKSNAQVVIFSTSTCPHCRDAKRLLGALGVTYRDFVIDQDSDAKGRFKVLNGDGVPLLFIGDRRILGFREGVIRDALKNAHINADAVKQ
ncbi:glutaredoxin family protein [Solilutibacter silvestris]|uniref:Glutaredoxin n=1 Tax=Solilutibacter silvestris TaxID=1645665 RepID=A0A2K1Q496_9GAMM|nr:glutaredoxin family protein [Lysobacter silvestris]PNS09833.1 Glutaredoxin [Lysobacter silvestris]